MNIFYTICIAVIISVSSLYSSHSNADAVDADNVQVDNRPRNTNFFLTAGRVFLKSDELKDEMTSLKFGWGYRFSPYFAMELFFMHYGEISEKLDANNTSSISLNSVILNAIGIIPLGSYFEFYTKAGVSGWKANADVNNSVVGSEDGIDPVYSVGLGYKIDYDSTIRLEYEYSDYDGTQVSVVSFGFQHNF